MLSFMEDIDDEWSWRVLIGSWNGAKLVCFYSWQWLGGDAPKWKPKIHKKERHVVVFMALSITWPSIFMYFFNFMKERAFGLTSSLRRCGQVSSTLPTLCGEYYCTVHIALYYWCIHSILAMTWSNCFHGFEKCMLYKLSATTNY